ncbi:MAG: hypothetical protein CL847_07120 [Crocinitomicaceae bacterium]|nr:hypothetical protein [Crocinitomicaceae bacterium]|tara:strand:+ start:10420 stop:10626 length:207 start_codon:yes stop_codon:yes gene_type:complete
MTNWITVYSDSFVPGVEMRKILLEEHDIPCVLVNRQCSSYSGVGFASVEVDLNIPEEYAERASKILVQ